MTFSAQAKNEINWHNRDQSRKLLEWKRAARYQSMSPRLSAMKIDGGTIQTVPFEFRNFSSKVEAGGNFSPELARCEPGRAEWDWRCHRILLTPYQQQLLLFPSIVFRDFVSDPWFSSYFSLTCCLIFFPFPLCLRAYCEDNQKTLNLLIRTNSTQSCFASFCFADTVYIVIGVFGFYFFQIRRTFFGLYREIMFSGVFLVVYAGLPSTEAYNLCFTFIFPINATN